MAPVTRWLQGLVVRTEDRATKVIAMKPLNVWRILGDDWLAEMARRGKRGRPLAATTRTTIEAAITSIVEFIGPQDDPAPIDDDLLLRFRQYLGAQAYSAHTVRTRCMHLRRFLLWAKRRHYEVTPRCHAILTPAHGLGKRGQQQGTKQITGRNVQTLFRELGVSQKQFAALLGVAAPKVWYLLHHVRRIRTKGPHVARIKCLFRMTPEERLIEIAKVRGEDDADPLDQYPIAR